MVYLYGSERLDCNTNDYTGDSTVLIVCRCSIQLPDDSTNTFVRALKDCVRPGIVMVVVILPSNRKDRYDAIKTYCCVENPGTRLPSDVTDQWLIFTARCTLVQSAVLQSHVVCPSVCPSVCLSVCP